MSLSLVENVNMDDRLSDAGKSLPPSGIREFFDIVYSMPDCISLGVGEPDFITPWRVSESGIYAIRDGCTHYTPNKGLMELRKLISEKINRETGVSYDPDTEIVITMGVSQGMDIAMRSIINRGDEVILLEPCYVSYPANVHLNYGTSVIVPTGSEDGFRIDVDSIARACTRKTKAILLNYPSNPTGATIDRKTLESIARLSIEKNLVVISDEIYSEIVYDHEHSSIISQPGMKERTLYMNGFSKSMAMTGWRLGYVAGPQKIIDVMVRIHQYTALCAPSIAQYAALEAMQNGSRDVKQMNREYLKRRNYIVKGFRDIGFTCPAPMGAFYIFPDISFTGMSSREFAMALLKSEKVAVVPGIAFGNSGENHIRCSFATSIESIKEAVKRIGRFCKTIA